MRTTVEQRFSRVVKKAIQLNAVIGECAKAVKESGEGLYAYRAAISRYTTLLELAKDLGDQLSQQYGGRVSLKWRQILTLLKKQDALNVERLKLICRLETSIAKRRAKT